MGTPRIDAEFPSFKSLVVLSDRLRLVSFDLTSLWRGEFQGIDPLMVQLRFRDVELLLPD